MAALVQIVSSTKISANKVAHIDDLGSYGRPGIGITGWQPVVQNGEVVAYRSAAITLAADHRTSDRHRGAGFLRAIIRHFQKPKTL